MLARQVWGNKVDDECVGVFATALCNGALPHVSALLLDRNEITDVGVEALALALRLGRLIFSNPYSHSFFLIRIHTQSRSVLSPLPRPKPPKIARARRPTFEPEPDLAGFVVGDDEIEYEPNYYRRLRRGDERIPIPPKAHRGVRPNLEPNPT